jgi:hypothetical protein
MQSVEEYLLKFFSPSLPFASFFFTLTFLDMIWVHVIHVLGMLGVLGVCNMLQHPMAHATDMLCAPNVGRLWVQNMTRPKKTRQNSD